MIIACVCCLYKGLNASVIFGDNTQKKSLEIFHKIRGETPNFIKMNVLVVL